MLFEPSLFYQLGALLAAWIGWLSVVSRVAPRSAPGWRHAIDRLPVRLAGHLVLLAATAWVALSLGMDLATDLACHLEGRCDYLTPRSLRWASVALVGSLLAVVVAESKGTRRRRHVAQHGYRSWD